MVSIRTDIMSLVLLKSLNKDHIGLNQTIERLITGYKLNHAADNAHYCP